VERECGEAFDANEGNSEMHPSDGNEETTATSIMQPSKIDDNEAIPEFNNSLDEVKSADPIRGRTME
jgi:hypothetical protein